MLRRKAVLSIGAFALISNGLLAQQLRDPFATAPARESAKPPATSVSNEEYCDQATRTKDILAEVVAVVPVMARVVRGELTGELKDSATNWAHAAIAAADDTLSSTAAGLPSSAGATSDKSQQIIAGATASDGTSEVKIEPLPESDASASAASAAPSKSASRQTAERADNGAPANPADAALAADVQDRVERLQKQSEILSQLCIVQPQLKELTAAEKLTQNLQALSDSVNKRSATRRNAPTAESGDERLRELKSLQSTLAKALGIRDQKTIAPAPTVTMTQGAPDPVTPVPPKQDPKQE